MNINEKLFSKEWFISYLSIIFGSFILAVGFVCFIIPYKIVPGGVYGIGIVVNYLTENIFSFSPNGFPIGLFGLLLNIPLTLIGIKLLGPKFGIKTVLGFVLTSAFMDLLIFLIGKKDPLQLQNEMLLSCIFGGILLGLGFGLIFRAKATSGGTDIFATILTKYTSIPLGKLMIYIDSGIVLLGLITFQDWKIPLYSWIVIYITGKVIDIVLEGFSYDKTIFIVSDKYEEIRQKIIIDLKRGGTMIPGIGMYNGSEKKVIFTNVNRRETAILIAYIREIDPNAFLTVINANEILGKGFRSIEEKGVL